MTIRVPSSQHMRFAGMLIACLALGACAHQPQTYSWDSYQPSVYSYLQGDADQSVHLQSMEKNIETARATNKPLPPGFHAQLGLLYLQAGQGSEALKQLNAEKEEFPESAPYMDFLLKQKASTNTPPSDQQTRKRSQKNDSTPAGEPKPKMEKPI